MEISALVISILGVLTTLLVAWMAIRVQNTSNIILAVMFNAILEGVKSESIGKILEPLTQAGYVSITTEANGQRYLAVSRKGVCILGSRVGKIKDLPRTPIDIKWD